MGKPNLKRMALKEEIKFYWNAFGRGMGGSMMIAGVGGPFAAKALGVFAIGASPVMAHVGLACIVAGGGVAGYNLWQSIKKGDIADLNSRALYWLDGIEKTADELGLEKHPNPLESALQKSFSDRKDFLKSRGLDSSHEAVLVEFESNLKALGSYFGEREINNYDQNMREIGAMVSSALETERRQKEEAIFVTGRDGRSYTQPAPSMAPTLSITPEAHVTSVMSPEQFIAQVSPLVERGPHIEAMARDALADGIITSAEAEQFQQMSDYDQRRTPSSTAPALSVSPEKGLA